MNNSNSFFEGILLLHVSAYSVIIDKHVLYVVMLFACCITGLGVGIAVGIMTSSLAFGIAIITVWIIAKYRMKGNYHCNYSLTG